MIGMIQILVWMFAVYLVFKGVEIFQLALTSSREGPSRGIAGAIGIIAILVAVAGAYGFVKLGDEQAARVGQAAPR
jgi:hypothetical protein